MSLHSYFPGHKQGSIMFPMLDNLSMTYPVTVSKQTYAGLIDMTSASRLRFCVLKHQLFESRSTQRQLSLSPNHSKRRRYEQVDNTRPLIVRPFDAV